MKKFVLVGLLMCGFALQGLAQQKASAAKKQVVGKKVKPVQEDSAVGLVNTRSYKAYLPASNNGFRISDPTINSFNQRAASPGVPINGSGMATLPKERYGFANGKILLRNTTATSSGTSNGSGAVGTGTALQGAGTSESSIGVNGKSPDAGPWLWGSKRPVNPASDSLGKKE